MYCINLTYIVLMFHHNLLKHTNINISVSNSQSNLIPSTNWNLADPNTPYCLNPSTLKLWNTSKDNFSVSVIVDKILFYRYFFDKVQKYLYLQAIDMIKNITLGNWISSIDKLHVCTCTWILKMALNIW